MEDGGDNGDGGGGGKKFQQPFGVKINRVKDLGFLRG
jgi:hypothetical protein